MPLCAFLCVLQGDTANSIGWPGCGCPGWCLQTHLGWISACVHESLGFFFFFFLEVVGAFRCSQIGRGSSVKAGKWAAGEAVVEAELWSQRVLIVNTNREERRGGDVCIGGNSSSPSGDTVKVAMLQVSQSQCQSVSGGKYTKKSNKSKKNEFQNGVPSADYITGL